VWVGERPGTIINAQDKYGEWEVEYTSVNGKLKTFRFDSEMLRIRDGYSVGNKVWAITPDGDKFEAIITHPQNENEEWGCQVKIGARDEDWNGTYYYHPDNLEPR